MISLNPYVIGALAVAQIALVSGVYLKGRSDAHEKCLREKLSDAAAAISEKDEDDAAQQEAAQASDIALRNEIARLRRQIGQPHEQTGLACDIPGSGDSVLREHRALFPETGLPAGDGSDEPRTAPGETALAGGGSADR